MTNRLCDQTEKEDIAIACLYYHLLTRQESNNYQDYEINFETTSRHRGVQKNIWKSKKAKVGLVVVDCNLQI